jgi:hypothetical protein
VSTDHVVSQPFQPVVDEPIVMMQYSTNPTLPLESDESIKVVEVMQSLADPSLILGNDVSIDDVFRISNSIPSEQGEFPLILSMLPPNSRMVPFDWSNLVEPLLISYAPFQIRVEVNSKKFSDVL